ncbi:STAS domain-containing protein [Nocardiopsis sp. MG754419]|uniref:STAS domain-containing protein n=1 Tax=Nocardiopsis sp. MG754419 TaxID=2259865 RepID=UPI001BA86EA4|nr:STAS domain-containing protein [Nocardiopsis sp. MG754419]MBR8742407.1 anti-anti-sigma factor [Nocardiopsis sp. MG754419]
MTVVGVHGEVDLATADRLRDRLLRAVEDSGCACLVVDMSGVGFFDASGVRALVSVHRSLSEQGRHMVLAEPTAIAERVLDALTMRRLFDVYPMVEMALSHTSGLRADGPPIRDNPVF